MPSKRKLLKLSGDLEQAILHGILVGVVPLDSVEAEELSKVGRLVLAAVKALGEGGVVPPYQTTSILLTVSEVLGGPRDAVREYLETLSANNIGSDAATILRRVRDKQLLVDIINEATQQLQRSSVDVGSLRLFLDGVDSNTGADTASIGDLVKDGLPDPPIGLSVDSLPTLTKLTGGIIGGWTIGGETGVGKSAFAWQLVLDIARPERADGCPAIVYDYENGMAVIMERVRHIYRGDMDRIRASVARIYLRDSIRSLDSDLRLLPPPALVVVDSIQSLATSGPDRRGGLDQWIRRFEALKKRGYSILLVSEVGRAHYGQDAYVGAFKETGSIEYKADCGMQLIASGDITEVHVVKNRHRPHKGLAARIVRRNDWYFAELGDTTDL